MRTKDYIYDLESYPNFFSCVIRHVASRTRWTFEVSTRRNNASEFYYFLQALIEHGCFTVGFNNVGYDYVLLHHILSIGPSFTYQDVYSKNQAIFASKDRFEHSIWPSDVKVNQIDLYKIHHFDNVSRSTSLKEIEFNMHSPFVGDLPFPPGTWLEDWQMDVVIVYNGHDVDETEKFYDETLEAIQLRVTMSERTGVDMMNFNDTKIGKKYFQLEMEKVSPGITGTSRNPRQTHRDIIRLGEIIFPYIEFQTPELQRVLTYLKNTSISETKSPPELKNLTATLNGFTFVFGAGGMHGSVSNRVVRSDPSAQLVDADVTSYYPTFAITHRVFPQHLSETFCDVYNALFVERQSHPKGTADNAALKLALNGVYGDSNSIYSKGFYDPQYTMTVTINCQLLIVMFAEAVLLNTDCELIQINTDGATFKVPNEARPTFDAVIEWWEKLTTMNFETAEYQAMWIRDVNNYIAQYNSGDVKLKGAYIKKPNWAQDHSALIVPICAEACMVHGATPREFIMNHGNAMDFMLRAKASGKKRIELEDGTPCQKLTRYHIAHRGCGIQIIYPPTQKKPGVERPIRQQAGWNVAVCDDIRDFDVTNLNVEWYIQEVEKLLITE